MCHFPIVEVSTSDDSSQDREWRNKRGKKWLLRLQSSPPFLHVQMLDIILFAELTEALLDKLITQARQHNYLFTPDCSKDMAVKNTPMLKQNSMYNNWIYKCGNISYQIALSALSRGLMTRLLFFVETEAHLYELKQMIHNALILTADCIVMQVATFDSCYNIEV